jgi:hypothetical protein
MNDLCTYQIQLSGQVNESEVNVMSPIHITLKKADPEATLFTVCTDQSGLVGLVRHIHGKGFLFLSIVRVEQGSSLRRKEST